jgi:hypothetical protein
LGQGTSGAGGTSPPFTNSGGKGGSGGANGNAAQTGSVAGAYGGGGGGYGGNSVGGPGGAGGELRYKNNISVTPGNSYTVVVGSGASGGYAGGVGAVRIIYPGTTRSFPSTNTGNL